MKKIILVIITLFCCIKAIGDPYYSIEISGPTVADLNTITEYTLIFRDWMGYEVPTPEGEGSWTTDHNLYDATNTTCYIEWLHIYGGQIDCEWFTWDNVYYVGLSVQIQGIPQIPEALDPRYITSTSFSAYWSHENGAEKYYLDLSTFSNFQNFSTYTVQDFSQPYKTFTGLTPGSTYYYRVRSNNYYGTSNYSHVKSVTLPGSVFTLYSIANGNWNNPAIWSYQVNGPPANVFPNINTFAIITNHQIIVNSDQSCNHLELRVGNADGALTISYGKFTIKKNINLYGGTIKINGSGSMSIENNSL